MIELKQTERERLVERIELAGLGTIRRKMAEKIADIELSDRRRVLKHLIEFRKLFPERDGVAEVAIDATLKLAGLEQ